MALTLDSKVTDGGDVGPLWTRTVGLATALIHALMLRTAQRKKEEGRTIICPHLCLEFLRRWTGKLFFRTNMQQAQLYFTTHGQNT